VDDLRRTQQRHVAEPDDRHPLGLVLSPRRLALLLLAAALWLSTGAAPVSAAPAPGERVAVYVTTHDLGKTLARERDLVFGPASGSGAGADQITVDPSVGYQRMTAGFGLAMTDTSAYELDHELPSRLRDRVMRQLFSREGGIGLSFLRVPIGGSDYIVGAPYTYDDMPAGQTDPKLAHFSIAHDQAYILPMIRQALALNPSLSIMANPWTPPAWMKTDDQLITTTGPLGTLEPRFYGAYAQYLVRFLEAYRAAGVPVQFLGVQNEPLTPLLFVARIPESYLSPQDEGTLIGSYVAPALRAAGLEPTILAYDDGFQRSEAYIPVVMAEAGSSVGGLAYHCYFSDPSSMSIEHNRYPNEPEFETECSSELSNLQPAQMAIRSLRNWAQGIQLWNIALDQNLGPKIGSGCAGVTPPNLGKQCIAPVIVNTNTHTYSFTSDYWQLGQFSSFISLGARRISSSDPSSCPSSPASGWNCGPEDVAFMNPDGSQVMVATSNDGAPHRLIVTERGKSFSDTIPDGATVTFKWPAPVPRIGRLRIVRHRFARFALSEDATVTLRLSRCTRRGRRRRCHWHRVRTVRAAGVAGQNRVRLTRRHLAPGRYRLTASAVDSGGDVSRLARRGFRVRR
jgi:glucosylceramidase